MDRLTTNKEVSEMGMYELAHNSCYIKDGVTHYRDFEIEMNARDLARKLMVQYGHWKSCEEYGPDADNELVSDDIFDDTMMENLMYGPNDNIGLIALFYRNLWAMADLRERLKVYEDADEQGLMIRLPFKVGDTVYYISEGFIEPCTVEVIFLADYKDIDGNCSYVAEIHYDREDCPYVSTEIYFTELGKTVFLSQKEAEQALKKMESEV